MSLPLYRHARQTRAREDSVTVTSQSLTDIEQHWAIDAVGKPQRERAFQLADLRLIQAAIGGQLRLDIPDMRDNYADVELLDRVATAYELAAIEGIDALLNRHSGEKAERLIAQAEAGAFRSYELRRALAVPSEESSRVFHVLHLAALAYCGQRWTDIRRWLKEHPEAAVVPSVATVGWDQRVLFRLFDCWIRLLRKDRWDDLDGIRAVVISLREDQKEYEAQALERDDDADARTIAFRLIALYHWAKATELLSVYMLQGEPPGIEAELNRHFEAAYDAVLSGRDPALDVLVRWLHVAARGMVSGSLWSVARAINTPVSRFINSLTKAQRPIFELLPPQRAALQEQNLLDPANRAVVVDLPTSGAKTVLAEFRILQALNQFQEDRGWVAYVAPTRALVAQVTRRLRADFGPIGIQVEQLTAAVDIDSFEYALLGASADITSFHVLVATPEKLLMVIRNKMPPRPLALVVMDEAHNIEDRERGMRIELLLATIKRDSPNANFLLLMPYVPNAEDLARWLAPNAGKTISLGTSAWLPNERIVGMFEVVRDTDRPRDWSLEFQTLTTTPKTIQLAGRHSVGGHRPLNLTYSEMKSLTRQSGAMAKVFSERGTSIGVARDIDDAWEMARTVAKNLDPYAELPPEISLVQRFLATEISPSFELIPLLNKGVGVHHTGLSDDARSLMEWLAEIGKLRVLCATTGIAQGINFPVASVFIATHLRAYGQEMSKREFWNLSGRAGRIDQDSVGVIGIAAGNNPKRVAEFVGAATEDLVSRLVQLLDELETNGRLQQLSNVIYEEEWTAFRAYVAHLWNEKQNLDAVLNDTEQLLRNTFGYGMLQSAGNPNARMKARALLDATQQYARRIRKEEAALSDATGFAPEGVREALTRMGNLNRNLRPSDWTAGSLFGDVERSALPHLVGIMMRIPEIRRSLTDLGGEGLDDRRIASIAQSWVTGRSIEEIAKQYFRVSKGRELTDTDQITAACKAVYRVLATAGTWGLAALTKMPNNKIEFDRLSEEERRQLNNLSAMLYHGVKSESAILMRMNSVPRSIAQPLGDVFEAWRGKSSAAATPRMAREFLRQLNEGEWQRVAPRDRAMTGSDYRAVWATLSGERV